jgi:hypothetical protein
MHGIVSNRAVLVDDKQKDSCIDLKVEFERVVGTALDLIRILEARLAVAIEQERERNGALLLNQDSKTTRTTKYLTRLPQDKQS